MNRKNFLLAAGITHAGILAMVQVQAAATESDDAPRGRGNFEFALIGDTPYGLLPTDVGNPVEVKMLNVITDINDNNKIAWVMHAGDIKAGSTPCSDAMFYHRLELYSLFEVPVILTPGDNEWADCHRAAAGGYAPLERLAKLREVFYPEPGSTIGGNPTHVLASQGLVAGYEEFPENVMWSYMNVMFAAVHIVGSNNAELGFVGRTFLDDQEVVRRNAAAEYWLNETFELAEQNESPGVFIMIHGNPDLEFGGAIGSAFAPFLSKLEELTVAYGKPVVLAHGDSHYFRIDKPNLVSGSFLPNFTRVETFGSANYHWVKVSVDPNSREVFGFAQQLIEDNN